MKKLKKNFVKALMLLETIRNDDFHRMTAL